MVEVNSLSRFYSLYWLRTFRLTLLYYDF